MTNYSKKYSKKSFWNKVDAAARSAGKKVLKPAFVLYNCLVDSKTPVAAKVTIAAALGYFIFPLDAIPDLTPIIGYSDDLGVMMAALGVLGEHIKQSHKRKADKQVKELLG